MKVFFSNYHISVNASMVDDLLGAGQEVIVPDSSFDQHHIKFFAGNDEHWDKPGVTKVNYEQFLALPPMAIILNCSQMYEDIERLYKARGEVDKLVLLSSQVGLGEWLDTSSDLQFDYVISHSLATHRSTKAKYKILYFSKPLQLVASKTPDEVRRSFENKKITLYVNHFDTAKNDGSGVTFTRERESALQLRELWEAETGQRIPFYGYENTDGNLSMQEAQDSMKDSMFTLCFKGHETWGQMVNESMQIGTPCIFMQDYLIDMFTEYMITKDTAVIGKSAKDIFKQIKNMTLEQYETLCLEAQSASNMYCNSAIMRTKLAWLFSKVEHDLIML